MVMKSLGLGSSSKRRFRSPTRDIAADDRRREELLGVVEKIRAELEYEYLGLARRLDDLRPTSSYLFGSEPGPVDTSDECRIGVDRAARLNDQIGLVEELRALIARGFETPAAPEERKGAA